MAWLEAAGNFLATLSYKLMQGDSGEGGRRRRETQHNYNGTEYWNSDQQYPSGWQDFNYYGYGHGGDQYNYGQGGGSEKQYYRGNPDQEQHEYSYHIGDENGESKVNVATSQRGKKKGAWRTLCRRIDYEESGMRTKQYVDWSGKPVVEQTPYRSRMYEENQYIPFEGEGEDDTGMNAAAAARVVPREQAKRKRRKKRW